MYAVLPVVVVHCVSTTVVVVHGVSTTVVVVLGTVSYTYQYLYLSSGIVYISISISIYDLYHLSLGHGSVGEQLSICFDTVIGLF